MKFCFQVLIIIILYATPGWVYADAPSKFYKVMPPLPLEAKEIEQVRSALKTVTEKSMPKVFYQWLVFEGTVIKYLGLDRYGQPMWLVRDEHCYQNLNTEFRSDGIKPPEWDQIKIATSKLKSGGVKLQIGRRYRIAATYADDFPIGQSERYFTWKEYVLPLQSKKAIVPADHECKIRANR